ncbi:hypothetical protein [Paenibacillus sp. OAS669]|uniref:hypothetical protein n=1 Tax=Paenibacillus sp. OAS669 TaxID=2663821 RepID=UPI0017898FC2|nr:hypothetical protein [Paenibacillus sp. OAS669]MBE1446151.1 hypothetical protein [Paenibacillus sp. OAS669]
MLRVLTLKEAPKKVIDLLHSGEQFGEYDTIHHGLYYGWLDLFERQNGTYYVGTRISNSAESMDMLLERLSKATYGSDAVFYQTEQERR